MYSIILWDIDGTLLDFEMAEAAAIRSLYRDYGFGECTDRALLNYNQINKKYWRNMELGLIGKQEVLVGRFREFLSLEGLDASLAESLNDEYQLRLGDTINFCENAWELVNDLKGKVRQYAVTNGTLRAQEKKLRNSGLDKIFDDVFISEVVGYEKPSVKFFEGVYEKIGRPDKAQMLIVGDSLTSDIRVGNRGGIKSCWYNPLAKANEDNEHVDYEIRSLNELPTIIFGDESGI